MKKLAILCNGISSKITDRVELVELVNSKGIQPYIAGSFDGQTNAYYCSENAMFLPIVASRNNTNPFKEIDSIRSVSKTIKKEQIEMAIIYGVKNHPAMAIGCKLGGIKKMMCIVNGSGNLFKVQGLKGKILRFMSFPMLKIAYAFCDSVCFQNEDDLNLFLDKKLIHNKKKVFLTAGSGVNLEKFPAAPLVEENRFLFLSRITESKGINEFIKAAYIVKERYPNAQFDIVGPLDQSVEFGDKNYLSEAEKDGIVRYHGETKDVPFWMHKCRFFVYPSYYPEGVPRCAMQALATGRPIITCDTPGCRVIVENGINGLYAKTKDENDLAEKMIILIQNPEMTEKMAKLSRVKAEQEFNVNSINESLLYHIGIAENEQLNWENII